MLVDLYVGHRRTNHLIRTNNWYVGHLGTNLFPYFQKDFVVDLHHLYVGQYVSRVSIEQMRRDRERERCARRLRLRESESGTAGDTGRLRDWERVGSSVEKEGGEVC